MRFIPLLLFPLFQHHACEGLPISFKNLKVRQIRSLSMKKQVMMVRIRGGNTVDSVKDTNENNMVDVETIDGKDKMEELGHKKDNIRHNSNAVRNILKNHEDVNEESLELRQKIDTRAEEYLYELHQAENKPPTPMKVLHKMAPKIPAIKHSPDFMLRIQTSRGDIDSGVAASLIMTIARLSIEYEHVTGESIGKEVVKDRRFEQLVECVICGVNVRRRKVEAKKLMTEGDDVEIDMEELLDEENVKSDEGLTVLDCCRAAWGISLLGGYHLESFGGHSALDIITALSLRTRELLLARLQMLRHGELQASTPSDLTTEEAFDLNSGDVAKDVASSIWTFACVKASTGLRTVSLFETCCSILCQDPTDLREREIAKHNEDNEVQDVVDRLARSEVPDEVATDVQDNNSKDGEGNSDGRHALLHWLAPNEVSDIMWAVAVHGRTDDTGSKQEMNLSETATALSETAFDVIVEALKQDLLLIKARQRVIEEKKERELFNETSEVPEMEYVEQGNESVFEVVDAATLLADNVSEEMTYSIDESLQNIEEVQVVDAAALLNSDQDDEVKTEVVYTKNPPTSETNTLDTHFSIDDICSIAWAATDLNDSMRNILVDLIIEIFTLKGKGSVSNLDGGQLSNLAWAIARRLSFSGYVPKQEIAISIFDLIEWINSKSLSLVNQDNKMDLLNHFEAPEIGRLMWSLATSILQLSQTPAGNRITKSDFREFALVALKAADGKSSMFGTEDLARVTWGFLELSDLKDVFGQSVVSAALGKVVSIMEQSILRWESGQCEKQERNRNSTRAEESFPFSSFLGKPRLSLKLLEQRLDRDVYDDDESPSSDTEKSFLPLLRDLSMDPATMCKIAYGLSRTHAMFPELTGAWTFVRVAVRLLTSKNDQLLKESAASDCARLAFSCTTNEVPGYRLYARRLVRHLNRILKSTDQDYVSDKLSVSPQELSMLIWSLGELGVRHWKTEEKADGSACKKLRLVTNAHLLPEPQLTLLPTQSTVRLLHGTILMEMLNSAPALIFPILTSLEVKLKADIKGVDLCELAECLAKIKVSVGKVEITTALPFDNVTEDDITDDVCNIHNTTSGEESGDDGGEINQSHDLSTAILLSNQRLLKLVAETASKSLHLLSANQMRRLLEIYAGLPFQVDNFVNATDVEIQKRLEAAHIVSNLQESANRAALAARSSWDALADKSDDSVSPLAALRKGLKSVFSHSSDTEGDIDKEREEEESSRLQEIADLLEETRDTSNVVTHNLALVSKLTNKDPGSLLSAEQRSAVFEMSRCRELIESYRRVNFRTGRRKSRHSRKRKEIGKNVISRMLKQEW